MIVYQQTDVSTRSTVNTTNVHTKLQRQNETTESSNVLTTPVQVTATPLQEVSPSKTVDATQVTATTQQKYEESPTSNVSETKSIKRAEEKPNLPSTVITNTTDTEETELQGNICGYICVLSTELVCLELVFNPRA